MGFFDSAKDAARAGMDRAADAAYGARASMNDKSIMGNDFAQEFARLCCDAFAQGWHEANGGNLSYLLSAEQAKVVRQRLDYEDERPWCPVDFNALELGGRLVLMTASGAHMRDMGQSLIEAAGIVEVAADGASWRVVWGFEGARPSSELPMHLRCLAAGAARGRRAVYHAHPENAIALTALVGEDSARMTRLLHSAFAESVIAFPRGVAVLGWYVPGTPELGEAVCGALEIFDAALLLNHGIVCAASSLKDAFGLVHTVEKAASIRLRAGLETPGLSPDEIAQIRQRYSL